MGERSDIIADPSWMTYEAAVYLHVSVWTLKNWGSAR